MTRKVRAPTIPETKTLFAGETPPRRQRGKRTPDAVRLRSGVTLSFPTLRRWHATLNKALASPRSASTALALTDMAADISALLGAALDPEYTPPVRPLVSGYVLTRPNGTEQSIRTSAEAAKLLGLAPTSLRVMLSRGDGVYKRTTDEGVLTLRRVYAASALA